MGKVTREHKRSIIGEQTTIDQHDPIDPSLIVNPPGFLNHRNGYKVLIILRLSGIQLNFG